MTEFSLAEGQAPTDSTGATGIAPEGTVEQSVASNQTTSTGSDGMAEESFFDPKDIAGTPLEIAYKQMQGAFTKRMQEAKSNQHMVDAYRSFEADPQGTIRQLAQQYGYQLVQPGQNQEETDWNPQTWDDVMARAREEARKEFQPLMKEVQNVKQANMETYLDNNHSDWRTYEDQMISILKDHPTMAKNPDLLYDMALPMEVKQARARKEAMAKINGQAEASQVSGTSTTTKKPSQTPEGIKSLDDAVAYAKQQLASKGIRSPGNY